MRVVWLRGDRRDIIAMEEVEEDTKRVDRCGRRRRETQDQSLAQEAVVVVVELRRDLGRGP